MYSVQTVVRTCGGGLSRCLGNTQNTKPTGNTQKPWTPHDGQEPQKPFFSSSSCIYTHTHAQLPLFNSNNFAHVDEKISTTHTHTSFLWRKSQMLVGIYFDHDEPTNQPFSNLFRLHSPTCVLHCIPEKRSHYFNDSILLSVSRARVLLRL